MSYCTFKYKIRYEDGEVVAGWAPCKGIPHTQTELKAFITAHFLKEKPVVDIVIFDLLKIESEVVWLYHVSKKTAFRYLCHKGVFDYNK